jgi:hypothetical protein
MSCSWLGVPNHAAVSNCASVGQSFQGIQSRALSARSAVPALLPERLLPEGIKGIHWGQWSCLRFGASQPYYAGEAVTLLRSAPRDHQLAQVQAAFCTERDDDIPFEHQPGTVEYKEALRKLAYAIAQALKAVPSKKQRRRAAVYLAPDFKPSSDKLRASLEHHFDVLPENPTGLVGLSPGTSWRD